MKITPRTGNGVSSCEETDALYWIKRLRALNEEIYSHCIRVAILAEKMGKELNLSEEQLRNLTRGCFLHDIGKVMVPGELLNKVRRLNEREREALDLHPVLGEFIVSAMDGINTEVIQTVRSHHEQWDGNGYPDRLEGEQIPLFSRICSIVSVFDNMLSERKMHKRKAMELAKSKLRRASGILFDAELVSLFLSLPDEMLDIYSP
ncbi:HD-GYP domain-containing protein [Paenibacillus caui]|uniref:HD-GYP domain-containing protein n=1 Tax=Paenibacillus caui TaxID=2873927 RepID=UPI00307FFEFA